jgi:pyrroloquinoline quinone (PQQ) biosynthesis protein C
MPNDFFINTESVQVEPDKVVMKTTNRTRLDKPESADIDGSCDQKMIDAETITNTRKLLNSAIISAWYAVKSERRPPALTPTRWVWRLAAFYHLCYSTPRLMESARERFALANRQILAQWAAQKAREEAGHDLLALRDIQSMGYDAEAVVEALFPPAAKTLLDYFTQSVQDSDPIDCVGYSYTAERLGICVGQGYIQSVEALLPPGVKATRCLRAHSAVSAEVDHVKETLEMIAVLTTEERDRVAKACHQAALLRFSPPQEAYISDKEIQNVLKPLKLTNNYA